MRNGSQLLLVAGFLAVSAMIAVSVQAKEGEGAPKAMTMTGEVVKVEASALTLVAKKEGGAGQEKTFAINAGTKVLVQTDEDDIAKGEGGKEKRTPKTREGTMADVKVGQRVAVTYKEDNSATQVLVLRAPKPRAGGEGKEK